MTTTEQQGWRLGGLSVTDRDRLKDYALGQFRYCFPGVRLRVHLDLDATDQAQEQPTAQLAAERADIVRELEKVRAECLQGHPNQDEVRQLRRRQVAIGPEIAEARRQIAQARSDAKDALLERQDPRPHEEAVVRLQERLRSLEEIEKELPDRIDGARGAVSFDLQHALAQARQRLLAEARARAARAEDALVEAVHAAFAEAFVARALVEILAPLTPAQAMRQPDPLPELARLMAAPGQDPRGNPGQRRQPPPVDDPRPAFVGRGEGGFPSPQDIGEAMGGRGDQGAWAPPPIEFLR